MVLAVWPLFNPSWAVGGKRFVTSGSTHFIDPSSSVARFVTAKDRVTVDHRDAIRAIDWPAESRQEHQRQNNSKDRVFAERAKEREEDGVATYPHDPDEKENVDEEDEDGRRHVDPVVAAGHHPRTAGQE